MYNFQAVTLSLFWCTMFSLYLDSAYNYKFIDVSLLTIIKLNDKRKVSKPWNTDSCFR